MRTHSLAGFTSVDLERIEVRQRLRAIIDELESLNVNIDVPRTIAEGCLEEIERLIAGVDLWFLRNVLVRLVTTREANEYGDNYYAGELLRDLETDVAAALAQLDEEARWAV